MRTFEQIEPDFALDPELFPIADGPQVEEDLRLDPQVEIDFELTLDPRVVRDCLKAAKEDDIVNSQYESSSRAWEKEQHPKQRQPKLPQAQVPAGVIKLELQGYDDRTARRLYRANVESQRSLAS